MRTTVPLPVGDDAACTFHNGYQRGPAMERGFYGQIDEAECEHAEDVRMRCTQALLKR